MSQIYLFVSWTIVTFHRTACLEFCGLAYTLVVKSMMKNLDSKQERLVLIIQQSGITDTRILDAFRRFDRADFVPPRSVKLSYYDEPIEIGYQQVTTQPSLIARMLCALQLNGDERVLEVGTGLGYQAALLSLLCREVYTIERIADLANRAKQNFEQVGIRNVHVRIGDGSLGLPDQAPFDRIILAAAAPEIPLPLEKQLAEGGKLIQPMGLGGDERVNVYEKKAGQLQFLERVTLARFVKLIGAYGLE
jgi:protein-L-isoaspartate(D-aspartate) O-methyltransferase